MRILTTPSAWLAVQRSIVFIFEFANIMFQTKSNEFTEFISGKCFDYSRIHSIDSRVGASVTSIMSHSQMKLVSSDD